MVTPTDGAESTGAQLNRRVLLDAGDVSRTIARVAHEVIEKNALDSPDSGRVIIIGIPTRGTTLANRLAAKVTEFAGRDIPVGYLDITLYRDDLRAKPHRALERTVVPPGGVDNAIVILVDDVLYSGRTVRAALDALRDLGRPAAVQLAVLIDRGHRELPLRADYVGKNIPTSRDETVAVHLAEHDGVDEVVLAAPTAGADGDRKDVNGADVDRPNVDVPNVDGPDVDGPDVDGTGAQ